MTHTKTTLARVKVVAVSQYPAAWFIRAAGLLPLFGLFDDAAIPRLTLAAVKQWRGRVSAFNASGMSPPAPKYEGGPTTVRRMLECDPAFAICTPHATP
jgi:hypothetical protein